jgi:hypothetical protein
MSIFTFTSIRNRLQIVQRVISVRMGKLLQFITPEVVSLLKLTSAYILLQNTMHFLPVKRIPM